MPVNSFSGGTVLSGSAVWNQPLSTPTPKPAQYRLTSQQRTNEITPRGSSAGAVIEATASTLEDLIAFELQLRTINYEFLSLERILPPPIPVVPHTTSTSTLPEESTNHV